DMLARHPWLRVTVTPVIEDPAIEQAVEVRLNAQLLRRIPLSGRITAEIPVSSPLSPTAPNVISLDYVYTAPPGWLDADLYRIVNAGALAPCDLYASSAGQSHGMGRSVLQLNGRDLVSPSRGYNLVALDPAGAPRAAAGFDTFDDPDATARLAAWVHALPTGT